MSFSEPVAAWCESREMEIKKVRDGIEATGPGLTIFYFPEDERYHIKIRHPDEMVMSVIADTEDVSVGGTKLIIERGDTQTVLKSTK